MGHGKHIAAWDAPGIVVRPLTQEEIQQAHEDAQSIANTAKPVVKEGQFVFLLSLNNQRI